MAVLALDAAIPVLGCLLQRDEVQARLAQTAGIAPSAESRESAERNGP